MKMIRLLILLLFTPLYFMHATSSDQIVYAAMRKAIKPLEKKYHLSSCGIGGAYKEGYKSLNLMLSRDGDSLNKEQARRLIIACLEEYINNLNADIKIKPYMKEFPISFKSITLTILNHDKFHNEIYHPSIGGIGFNAGEIIYTTYDPNDIYTYSSEETETYEEALAILKAEKESKS